MACKEIVRLSSSDDGSSGGVVVGSPDSIDSVLVKRVYRRTASTGSTWSSFCAISFGEG